MNEPGLADILDAGWGCLEAARALAGMAHHPVLATVSDDGPQARTVVLRVADRANGLLEMQTDLGSNKVDELRADPRAQLMVWNVEQQTQVRASVRIEVLTGDVVRDRWAKIPEQRHVGYGAVPTPGTPIDAPFAYEKTGVFEGYAVLRAEILRLEVMQLLEPHRRAVYERADGWRGQWVVP